MVRQQDFDLPDVCDGGPPIQRVAARVNDLRNDGYAISMRRAKNHCAIYELVEAELFAEVAAA
jgi:hypothetical protein